MNHSSRFQSFVRLGTVASLLFSQLAVAAPPESGAVGQSPTVNNVDVMLGRGGVLHGYVVNAQGVPAPKVEIVLTTAAGEQISTVSDDRGRFGYRGLDGGSYQLATEHGVVLCRTWTANTAPPRSAATILLVHDEQLIRGQWSAPPTVNSAASKMKRVMTNPFAVATIIGAAVAIPVAIHNANQDDSGS